MKNIVVIGGGPAGIMAASVAASRGNNVVLIEKNDTLGKKLLITGKGRCNITNNAPIEDFIKNVPVNGSFMYSSFYNFTNDDLVALLKKLGLETKVERGGRIFPVSDKSIDVLNALKKMLSHYKVRLLKAKVVSVKVNDNEKLIKLSDNRVIKCDSVIIATGGKSYPLTGSTGDGYAFASSLGHTITPIKPSLVPLEICEDYVKELMGLSLKNIEIKVASGKKVVYKDFGEMLFTHFGLSGPVILSASSHLKSPRDNNYILSVDLKPALDEKALDRRILRDFEEMKNKDFANSLGALLPKKLIPVIIRLSGIDPHVKINEIKKEERARLVNVIKNLTFTIKDFRPVKEAIITSGGVSVKEINPSTMESKLVPGLYFAGEIIDVDAYTGGFNLQIAFSTGYTAGKNA